MENPERFLMQKYWGSEEFREATEKTAERAERRTGESISNEPDALIENYLKRFTDIFEEKDEKEREHSIKALKRLLYYKYIIKPKNISEGYIKGVLFGNFAERKGYNRSDLKDPNIKQVLLDNFQSETGHSFEDYQVPKTEQDDVRNMVIRDQKAGLDSWLDYLTTDEAKRNIPAAYRYWVFAEMLELGNYDDNRKAYNTRTLNTTAPFPELDQQALACVLDEVRKKQKGELSGIILTREQDQNEFKKRLSAENFGKLYAFIQEHLKTLRLPTERLIVTEGEWRIFPKGSSAKEVVKAIAGFHTQWCIAGEGTAEKYLEHSDLHIYFSKDKDNKNSIPRVCIVHSETKGIAEMRGIMSNETAKQHLDDYITSIVDVRLRALSGGEKWRNNMDDMKRLSQIHIKHLQRKELSKQDIRFLYEIDRKIQGTGYSNDPRIENIRHNRDIKEDLSFVLDLPKEQISVTEEEALSGNIKYHYGSLNLSDLTSAEGLNLPESVSGYLYLASLTSAEGLKFPESVGGGIDLRSLTSAEGLNLPESVGGEIDLRSLTSAEGLNLPKSVGGYLYLESLTSAEGLNLPESVGGGIDLRSLTSAEGLKFPESVGGYLNLRSLISAEGLNLPKSVGGGIDLASLTSAEGLKFPESVGGYLYLRSLISAEGLNLPKSVGGDLNLRSLTSAEGLNLPESVGGYLYLESLTSAEGLKFPESVGGGIDLRSLTSAEGLKFPESVGGYLYLRSLISAEGLNLPKSVGGYLYLGSLTSAEGLKFPESVGGYLYLSQLSLVDKNKLRQQYPSLKIL